MPAILLGGCSAQAGLAAATNTPLATISPSPLPAFLYAVFPEPGAVLSLQEYSKPEGDFFLWDEQQPVVCVEVNGDALFDSGYDWNDKWVVERTKVAVDGVHREKVVGNVHDFLQAVETAEGLIGTGPWGWCLATPLTPGIHRVDVSVEKISGAIDTYAWTFELIDKR